MASIDNKWERIDCNSLDVLRREKTETVRLVKGIYDERGKEEDQKQRGL